MTDFSPTSSKYTLSVCVCIGIREHYAIVLMGISYVGMLQEFSNSLDCNDFCII